MSIRTNEVNNGGVLTISGGNMPANIYTNPNPYISRVVGSGNSVVSAKVIASGNVVEIGGDGGVWDTVAGVAVNVDKTTIDTINL